MKHKRRILFSVIFLIIALTGFVFAQSSVPGSDDDPVVTKSYVDQKSVELKTYIDTKVSGVTSENSGSFAVFTPVLVKAGSVILGQDGTEMILRSGYATAIEVDHNGISDLTAGKDLKMNEKVEKNHYLIIPRGDGRGIKITTAEDAWVMIKGGYTVTL